MKFRIFLKSYNNDLISEACKELGNILLKHDCNLVGVVALPMRIKKFCVLRSPHVDKDSREHFELRLYKRFFDVEIISPQIMDILLRAELPSGVCCSLKILEK
jgi:small subunit ribosomal protein S10